MRGVSLFVLLVALAACGSKRAAPATPSSSSTTNRPPIVRARCEPCTVAAGQTATIRAEAQDPDRDPLTYSWRAPAGTFTAASAPQTSWTAPAVEGPVFLTVRVEDAKGGSASDVITVTVTK